MLVHVTHLHHCDVIRCVTAIFAGKYPVGCCSGSGPSFYKLSCATNFQIQSSSSAADILKHVTPEYMAPGLSYYWLCVLETTTKIILNVQRRKAAQCIPGFAAPVAVRKQQATGTMRDDRVFDTKRQADAKSEAPVDQVDSVNIMPVSVPCEAKLNAEPNITQPAPSIQNETPELAEPAVDSPALEQPPSAPGPGSFISSSSTPMSARVLQSSKVPSSRIGRLFHYGGKSLFSSYLALPFIILQGWLLH